MNSGHPPTENPQGENAPGDRLTEVRQILDALFEERATPEQFRRLDELVVSDPACRRFYLDYVDLHGNLYWDAAQGGATPVPIATPVPEPQEKAMRSDLAALVDSSPIADRRSTASRRNSIRWVWSALAVSAVALVAALALWPTPGARRPVPDNDQKVANVEQQSAPVKQPGGEPNVERPQPPVEPAIAKSDSTTPRTAALDHASSERPTADRSLPGVTVGKSQSAPLPVTSTDVPTSANRQPDKGQEPPATAAHERQPQEPKDVVAFIDSRLKKSWKTGGVKPSPRANDGEWLRRVYLDLVGHIPPEGAVDAFLRDEDEGLEKRTTVVEQLVKQSDYARNWSTLWTNLLVGRQPRNPGVNREQLEKFLRDSFSANVPWNEVVYELVSAEGTPEQNPATNFLLAHLNNDAVPATAMTARLLLGVQVQCMQCHDHPFQNDKQGHFWELKSFFAQTEMASTAPAGMGSGDMAPVRELVSRKVGGPIYYETRRGEMRVAYPIYAGHKIDPGPGVNRRRELARLIAKGDDRQVALALVNRMWQHFFGYGFTRPVDDMGPHNPPTNPEILDRLADEFIASGYDLKQLCRWITTTDAYQRTSVLRPENRSDNPANGAPAAFSRVYLKPMTAEQLYDSLLLATQAKSSARTEWSDPGRRRQDWVRQFVMSYGTDENDEATVPAGSISQALVMMNDSIVRSALSVEPGTLLDDVLHARASDATKIRRLCRSALSRDPKPAELTAALEQLRAESNEADTPKARQQAQSQALQDIFWAFLNSNEFAFVH
jgi:hypothetical protein